MTDTQTPEVTPPEAGKPACRRKKVACLIVIVLLAILIATAAFFFCPWIKGMYGTTAPQNLTQINDRIAALDQRVGELETKMGALGEQSPAPAAQSTTEGTAHASDIAHMQSDLASLTSALTALQTEVKQTDATAQQARAATQHLLTVAIAFIQLREAVMSGGEFAGELAHMRTAIGGDVGYQDALGKLDSYAADGVPSFLQLRESLDAGEAVAINDTDKAEAHSWWQRVVLELKGLVSVRPLYGSKEADAFNPLKTALGRNDAPAALDAFKNLPPEAQKALADWHGRLETRARADDALRALETRIAIGPEAAAQGMP